MKPCESVSLAGFAPMWPVYWRRGNEASDLAAHLPTPQVAGLLLAESPLFAA